jgi:hypothetical protein
MDWLSSTANLHVLSLLPGPRELTALVTKDLRGYFQPFLLRLQIRHDFFELFLHVREILVDVIMSSFFVSSGGCSDCF